MGRISGVREQAALEKTVIVAVLSRSGGSPISVDEAWAALESAGFHQGDGDLFWRTLRGQGGAEVCAEPWSEPGYFHRGDLGSSVAFPDIAIHVPLSDVGKPDAAIEAVGQLAGAVSVALGASCTHEDGAPWSLDGERARIGKIQARLRR